MSSSAARILVVEDDLRLAELLRQQLGALGYRVDTVPTGGEAIFRAEEEPFDLILLDLQLPDLDGIEVAERLRDRVDASILMLTARADVDSRVAGLYAGASDYLVKPFSMHELAARIHARLRERASDDALRYQGLTLEPTTHALVANGQRVILPELEFRTLELLLRYRNRLLSKDDLERHLYGPDRPDSNTVEVFIHNLRRKLAGIGYEGVIRTVRGKGYLIR